MVFGLFDLSFGADHWGGFICWLCWFAVMKFKMILHHSSSATYKATLLGGTYKFASNVVAVEMIVQSEEIFPFFASVTLVTYQWSGRMDSGSVSKHTISVEEMPNNNEYKMMQSDSNDIYAYASLKD